MAKRTLIRLTRNFFITWEADGLACALKKTFKKLFCRNKKDNKSEAFLVGSNKQVIKAKPKDAQMSISAKAGAKPVRIMPYLDGPESTKSKRISPYYFAAGLLDFDVISFDAFDTLVFRQLNQPADIFMLVGEKLGIFNFVNIRMQAEREVREQKLAQFSNNEVTIYEIYERVAYYTGIDAAKGVSVEIETELDMCYANPYMYRVFEIAKTMNKKIVITSNMYLPSEVMSKLLCKCGYEGIDEIFVSCDYDCSKTNGSLFRIIQSKYRGLSIVHIGDTYHIDVEGARMAGLEGRHYKACKEFGEEHRSPGMSPLINSAYRSIVNNHLHNGTENYTLLEEYGFIYGGIIALGFTNWIYEQSKIDQVEKVLFLSRDGYILNEVYKTGSKGIPSEYVYWSRLMAMRNVCPGEREPFLRRLISERKGTGDTINDLLIMLGINSDDTELFKEKKINRDTYINTETEKLIIEYFVNNWDEINRLLQNGRCHSVEYILSKVGNAKKVAIIDVGWSGKNLGPLRKLLEKKGIKSVNYMLGTITKAQTATDTLSGVTKCYMFNSEYNRDIHDRFCKESIAALEAVEKLFTAPQPSFMGFNAIGEAEFCFPEERNYSAYYEIQSGIRKFVDYYRAAFGEYQYMLRITGYDAFIPIRLAFSNRKYLFKVLGDVTYNFGISPNDRRPLAEVYGGKI
ncbi:MAG: HAD-IA family hydrolase [Clostridia bacterium]|nr:HAD-IA family hydrolase [Clostridia bacterium]